jgi:aminopeptidase
MLEMDEGARYVGEVAFGMNDEIQRATNNVAFDEKIGGTTHIALGAAFPEAGGTNRSSLHWDIVCDLRHGGEVYGDGELLARDGAFLCSIPASSGWPGSCASTRSARSRAS